VLLAENATSPVSESITRLVRLDLSYLDELENGW